MSQQCQQCKQAVAAFVVRAMIHDEGREILRSYCQACVAQGENAAIVAAAFAGVRAEISIEPISGYFTANWRPVGGEP